eukprot:TRINITY_DN3069_c0_g3_i1.p2 TRINITY_DN3069_c0_g3~~TRINITY_DN3069_c0_g3_i1.p2  ORF type:complete len:137 (+),score=50.03 TRINITY_DN3069_c0_g3_i1:42-413(+)
METRRLGMQRDAAQEEAKQLGRKFANLEEKLRRVENEKQSSVVSSKEARVRSQHSQSDMTSHMIDRWVKECESAKESRRDLEEQLKHLTKDHQQETKKAKGSREEMERNGKRVEPNKESNESL